MKIKSFLMLFILLFFLPLFPVLAIEEKSDLIISDASYSIQNMKIGDIDKNAINFNVEYKNISNVDINKNISFCVSSGPTSEYKNGYKACSVMNYMSNNVAEIKANTTYNFTLQAGYLLPVGEDLNEDFTFYIDKAIFYENDENDNIVEESNESNNTFVKNIFIEDKVSKPDLVITNASYDVQSIVVGEQSYDEILFNIGYRNNSNVDILKNISFCVSSGATDEYQNGFKDCSMINFMSTDIARIDMNKDYFNNGQLNYLLPTGKALNEDFTLYIDRDLYPEQINNDNLVDELNENNNTFNLNVEVNSVNEIIDLETSDITDSSVVISWNTKNPSNSIVEYYSDGMSIQNTISDRNYLQTEHSVIIDLLKSNTKYFFTAMSKETSSDEAVQSEKMSFTTSSKNNLPDLIIADIVQMNNSTRVYYKNYSNNKIERSLRNKIKIEFDVFSEDYNEGFVYAGNLTDNWPADMMSYEKSYVDFPVFDNKKYYTTAVVDYGGDIAESNEDNNIFTKILTTVENDVILPDLLITDVVFEPEVLKKGGDGKIKVIVKNNGGDAISTENKVYLYIDFIGFLYKLEELGVDSNGLFMKSNSSKTFEFDIDKEKFNYVDNHDMSFKIDTYYELNNGVGTPKGYVVESNENNNSFTKKIRVVESDDEMNTCSDTDNGKNYFKKGTAKGIAEWGKSLNIIERFDDYCTGSNGLNELSCNLEGYVVQENVQCENGCYLGACCGDEGCEKKDYCNDSDTGKNYKNIGEVSVVKYNNLLKFHDKCVKLAPSQDGYNFYVKYNSQYYSSVGECQGEGCYIAEAFCNNSDEAFSVIPCSSCSAGGCSLYEKVDDETIVEVEISEDEKDADLNKIYHDSYNLFNDKIDALLNEINELRDIVKEQQTQIKYLSSLKGDVQQLSEKVENALNNFITYGVDDNTKKLGAGERAAVIYSYKSAFEKLPETEEELADAIKIANGRWPGKTNKKTEKKAKEQFQKIYKKIADMDNPNDNAAITVMAYGLRQKAENRNLESEKTGIKTFKGIYGHNPTTTEEWNIMQAITYSGSSRGEDTDGDLLIDEREAELGTDPNNIDTDGDGYLDGVEVANGYDPLN